MRVRSITVLPEHHQISLIEEFHQTRALTGWICENLETEDYVIQTSPEVSPPKWHLAHTTWFFEQFILKKHSRTYREFSPEASLLFNSYYKSQGHHWPQERRGELSRPTVKEIYAYRGYVDEAINRLCHQSWSDRKELTDLLRAGIEHEKQHQELLLMDIKAILGRNRPSPSYFKKSLLPAEAPVERKFEIFNDGIYELGSHESDFHFDNEGPHHRELLPGFSISNCFVTNQEYLNFMDDGGYKNPALWLSDGWAWRTENQVEAPLYWRRRECGWQEFTLHGLVELESSSPVCHVSFFEANAYARWARARLPRENEYEIFLRRMNANETHDQNIGILTGQFHPRQADRPAGELWGWTESPYQPYPGFVPFGEPLTEYNGKFMCNQYVLRGGCIATPPSHFRSSYRNFYYPQQRWMFSGIRLARDNP